MTCVIKSCFSCGGGGQLCGICGEEELACSCDEMELEDCSGCEGSGFICVEHESPSSSDGPCDATKDLAG